MAFYRLIIVLLFSCSIALAQSGTGGPPAIPSQQEISDLKARAASGDPKAQVKLGQLYEDGIGVSEDSVAAARWYRQAAEQGDPAAQNNLGVMYRMGRGVDKDLKEAIRWYQKASRQAYPNAYFNLGTAYYNGDGVPTDYDLAYAWFALAAQMGSKPAQDAMQRTAQEIPRTIDIAYFKTGHLLETGGDLPQNLPEAANWYHRAADAGNVSAAWKLGELYTSGRGVAKDDAAAATWRAKALKSGDADLMFEYGNMLRTGNGATSNPAAAAEWYRRAAAQRHVAAMLNLGLMYWQGVGVPHDNVRAYLLIVGAQLGSGEVASTAARAQSALEAQMSPEELERARKQTKKEYGNGRGATLTPKRKP